MHSETIEKAALNSALPCNKKGRTQHQSLMPARLPTRGKRPKRTGEQSFRSQYTANDPIRQCRIRNENTELTSDGPSALSGDLDTVASSVSENRIPECKVDVNAKAAHRYSNRSPPARVPMFRSVTVRRSGYREIPLQGRYIPVYAAGQYE